MSHQTNHHDDRMSSLEAIAERTYAMIASAFPVCAGSDEFYFFPQVVQEEKDWRVWDDFSYKRLAPLQTLCGEVKKTCRDSSSMTSRKVAWLTPNFCCSCCGPCASSWSMSARIGRSRHST